MIPKRSICLLALAISRLNNIAKPVMEPALFGRAQPLVLDAGHGGEDGGAVSITGVPESRFNLAIVLKLRDVLGMYGVDPILLREEDISLHNSSANTLREKKNNRSQKRSGQQDSLFQYDHLPPILWAPAVWYAGHRERTASPSDHSMYCGSKRYTHTKRPVPIR